MHSAYVLGQLEDKPNSADELEDMPKSGDELQDMPRSADVLLENKQLKKELKEMRAVAASLQNGIYFFQNCVIVFL